MIAVIFEVNLKPEGKEAYFDIAAELKNVLVKQPGFILIERFVNVSDSDRYLSLSFWDDKASVLGWRDQFEHRRAQYIGKSELFLDFRLRVANIIRDYDMSKTQAPNEV
ncbi:antibiotic biosynthesis monooxygenase [Pseudoalteromonas luteoviolacea]|uniref:antibiotic biosynthesis monooxygenase family protein n=1 Tax=Pseudoalteromonas luteoviolacea TaxID=43657 RepID=UPI001F3234E3|nr:antibiotic biosynthesis monooxygenase [Pseudoalteromonas luteoviolacea]MCF6439712.1 antibiotic biosynthesis monooxygenase [Pseudoalteromonas luteoviolacea]